ncbi:hypothetical protein [Bacteroides fragilis]|uniref:hypothetical protein n=1 Tax=Bacteroides fragilis TaxID=817 RepID=UPI001C70A398|nr:hypothetical protein [Bacteroides fragilis]MBW9279503.1 hypothetical protein [Bacteroides fragilis]
MAKIYITEFKRLKQEIETKLHLSGQTGGYIAKFIDDSYPDGISLPQLNRIWSKNYIPKDKDYIKMTDNVINDLVKIVGFENWQEYKDHLNNEGINQTPTNIFYNVDIDVSKLENGQIFTLGWKDKYCVLKYRGELEFEVLKSVNMKSEVGRIFLTPGFAVDTSDGMQGPTIKLDDGEGNVGGNGYFQHHTEEYNDKPFDKEFHIVRFDDDYFYL